MDLRKCVEQLKLLLRIHPPVVVIISLHALYGHHISKEPYEALKDFLCTGCSEVGLQNEKARVKA